jgi:hypothetical protein
MREGPLRDEGLRYVFALASVWSFLAGLFALLLLATLAGLTARLLLLTALLLTALLFLSPALILRTVALLTLLLATLLAHATLLTITIHVLSPFWTALSLVQSKESRLLPAGGTTLAT